VESDIKGFFDNIDHEWLLKMLALRIDVIDRANMYHTESPVCVPGMIG